MAPFASSKLYDWAKKSVWQLWLEDAWSILQDYLSVIASFEGMVTAACASYCANELRVCTKGGPERQLRRRTGTFGRPGTIDRVIQIRSRLTLFG